MTRAAVPWISKLRIENFKSIEAAELDLGPLTVLVGANSAGKSSVLQTLVLLSQIVRGRSQGSLVNLNGAELQLGTFTDITHSASAGGAISISVELNVADNPRPQRRFRARRSVRETLRWGLVLGRPQSKTQIGSAKVRKVELEARKSPQGPVREGGSFVPTRSQERLDAAAARNERIEQYRLRGDIGVPSYGLNRSVDTSRLYDARVAEGQPIRRPFDLDAGGTSPLGSSKRFSLVNNGLPIRSYAIMPDSGALASTWLHGIEAQLRKTNKFTATVSSQRVREAESSRKSALESSDEIIALLLPSFLRWVIAFDSDESPKASLSAADLDRFFKLLDDPHRLERELPRALAAELQQVRTPREILTRFPTQLDDLAFDLFDRMMTGLWYLGPLREDPSPAYRPGQGGGVAKLGLKGEYTVPELERFGSTEIEVMLPPDAGEPLCAPAFDAQPDQEGPQSALPTTTLKLAVDKWMTYLGVANAVEVRPTGMAGIELTIVDEQTKAERILTNVGVGVSQLLPVVVMCLRAQRGDVVMIEQPELHLHPAPQQALGDFLLAMAMSGRQLIVETHSEYLINRLRLRIAEDDAEIVSSLVKVIYAERRDGKTQFRSIKPNAYGSFDDWPDNFFDQAPKETEKILRAAMAKRKRHRERAGDQHPSRPIE